MGTVAGKFIGRVPDAIKVKERQERKQEAPQAKPIVNVGGKEAKRSNNAVKFANVAKTAVGAGLGLKGERETTQEKPTTPIKTEDGATIDPTKAGIVDQPGEALAAADGGQGIKGASGSCPCCGTGCQGCQGCGGSGDQASSASDAILASNDNWGKVGGDLSDNQVETPKEELDFAMVG